MRRINMNIDKLKKLFFNKEFIIFIIIGVINTLSSTVFAMLYSKVLAPTIAFVPGYLTGVVVSYTLNSIVTFKEKLNLNKFIKFGISTIPNFAIQWITVYIIVELLGLHKLVAYGLAAVIGVPVTFIILKLFVFIKK